MNNDSTSFELSANYLNRMRLSKLDERSLQKQKHLSCEKAIVSVDQLDSLKFLVSG